MVSVRERGAVVKDLEGMLKMTSPAGGPAVVELAARGVGIWKGA